ncbi:hypothetical protein OHB36_23770 [Streptomyces sp. NBC_00320]|uniref:hypothetical protein n=1 Tax=unclassified Streptomyces TaxID=2593676 RepID=UPI000A56485F|nr:hypothetical protein [Streptomyces sp. NBC_00320]MCX5149762.1 hypothetical protein [Streptomyces sp. NBC_00320]
MIIALFIFLLLGLIVAVTPGAALGYAFVAVSGRLSRGARVAWLLVLAAASSLAWLDLAAGADIWRPALVVVSFTATLASGMTFLAREASRRRAPRYPAPAWPARTPPTDSR